MIRKLQRLQSKKGFTLVELLVVIAIIGVLAAILIPLMNNYLRSSRIQSANSTAAAGKNNMTFFLQEESLNNRGYINATDGTVTATVNDAGVFTVVTTGTGWSSWYGGTNPAADVLIKANLEEAFPDARNGTFAFRVTDGYCDRAVWVPGAQAAADALSLIPAAGGFHANLVDGRLTAAVGSIEVGTVVGTAGV